MTPANPAAFPVAWPGGASPTEGMSLRDWFAGQAISAIIQRGEPSPGIGTTFDMMAADAYAFADALLAQREKPND